MEYPLPSTVFRGADVSLKGNGNCPMQLDGLSIRYVAVMNEIE
jgi:hypothetical protein